MITGTNVSSEAWSTGTGWHLEQSGWCSGDRCVPTQGLASGADGAFDTRQLAAATQRGVYEHHGVVAVGPEFGSDAPATAGQVLPDLVLQDRAGNPVTLASLVGRRRRMVLHAWAPW